MRVCYSELACLGNPVLENVRKLVEAGADSVELMMDGSYWDTINDNWKHLSKELKKIKVKYSVHPPAWDTNLVSQMYELRNGSWDLHEKALYFAAEIEANQMVLHPGFYGSRGFDLEECKRRAKEITVSMAELAKPLGVKLALENVGYHGQSLYTMEEYSCVLDDIDDTVGYLIDTGHANINKWDVPFLIRKLASRLYGVHIHDNNGLSDQHLPMYEGNLNWSDIFSALKEVPSSCELILEYTPGTPLEKLKIGKELISTL